MALINCRECGKVVSDTAEKCPHCGAPVKEQSPSPVQKRIYEDKPKRRFNGYVFAGLVLQALGYIAHFIYGVPYVWWPIWVIALILCIIGVRKSPRDAIAGLVVVVVIGLGTIFYTIYFADDDNFGISSSLERSIKNVETVEEAERLIDNTTWHYTADTSTDDIGWWVKVTFKNGRYTSYYANPSDGRWTQQGEGAYEIKEDRYSNTGEKYISVHWDGGGYNGFPCKYALILNNFQFAVASAVPTINPYSYSHRFETPSPDYGYMELGDYEWN